MSEVIDLSIFFSRLESVCDEMGALLQKAAFSPNIKDRLDFSCAIFDKQGQLAAQAAHIPVHLGSMAYAMAGIVDQIDWQEGDTIVVNDPFLGGTHLPDVTLISPVFYRGEIEAFVANRAHHANIGADVPGSMPITRSLEEEGIVLAPSKLIANGQINQSLMSQLSAPEGEQNELIAGDFYAQIGANQLGVNRLSQQIDDKGAEIFNSQLQALNLYAEKLALACFKQIPNGTYQFEDMLDDDGVGSKNIVIKARLTVAEGDIEVNFNGSSPQVEGNVNCPLSVAAAAVFYCFRCLMPDYTPACAGTFRPIKIKAPEACIVNAQRPAAVAAGNVETSSRITDVIFGALVKALPNLIPAASQGTMNNVAMGARAQTNQKAWDYYETLGGGSGAGAEGEGLSGRQTHMTNTLNTPVESIESHYPLRIKRYQLRKGSGGAGQNCGGDGVIREYQFLEETEVSLITERRVNAPWGLNSASAGEQGLNQLNEVPIAGKTQIIAKAGDVLTISTPGGGGWNPAPKSE